MDILLEEAQLGNLRKYQEALDYIQGLPFLQAESNMKRIGKTLIEKEPKGSTKLIKLLCTNPPVPNDANETFGLQSAQMSMRASTNPFDEKFDDLGFSSKNTSRRKALRANPEEFIHLFVRRPRELKEFLEFLVESELSQKICTTMVYHTLLEIYMRDVFELQQKVSTGKMLGKASMHASQQQEEIDNVKAKIMRVLRTERKYDQTHALSLAKLYRVEEAVVYLYEQLRLFQEIVSHYVDQKNGAKILETCEKFNHSDTRLWVHAFVHFCYEKDADKEIKICLS